jgi:hypothetical protein
MALTTFLLTQAGLVVSNCSHLERHGEHWAQKARVPHAIFVWRLDYPCSSEVPRHRAPDILHNLVCRVQHFLSVEVRVVGDNHLDVVTQREEGRGKYSFYLIENAIKADN